MVDRADINGVLMQMRALKAQTQNNMVPAVNFSAKEMKVQELQKANFGDLIKGAVDKVNEQQAASKALATAYERGDASVDLTEVMISLQKSSVAFQALTQVRNRVTSAYEDVMKMPI